jgi:hypothetical protein
MRLTLFAVLSLPLFAQQPIQVAPCRTGAAPISLPPCAGSPPDYLRPFLDALRDGAGIAARPSATGADGHAPNTLSLGGVDLRPWMDERLVLDLLNRANDCRQLAGTPDGHVWLVQTRATPPVILGDLQFLYGRLREATKRWTSTSNPDAVQLVEALVNLLARDPREQIHVDRSGAPGERLENISFPAGAVEVSISLFDFGKPTVELTERLVSQGWPR